MLERISEVQGIGLLHNAKAKKFTCNRTTLIYGDNGRGKSTLAAIFRSASSGDGSALGACRTISGSLAPMVALQFGSGHSVTFQDGKWSERRPELLVFDSAFVEKNVYSGAYISTDHRKNLLTFALGEGAVSARQKVDISTAAHKAASDEVQLVVAQLSGLHPGLTLSQFEALNELSDIDERIAQTKRRLATAQNAGVILARSIPSLISVPSFDLEEYFQKLQLTLEIRFPGAEKRVGQHLAKLGQVKASQWLREGTQLQGGSGACPYCDQDVEHSELVQAYFTYFDAAYITLIGFLHAMQVKLKSSTSGDILKVTQTEIGAANASAITWSQEVGPISFEFDNSATANELEVFRVRAQSLLDEKLQAPTTPLDVASFRNELEVMWKKVLQPFYEVNAQIEEARAKIENVKAKISLENIEQITKELLLLQHQKRRFESDIVSLFEALTKHRGEVAKCEKQKKESRDALDELMSKTLAKYQASINVLLAKFGATFRISDMTTNFRGGSPRSDFALMIRGKQVSLEGGPPSFGTTLSEGDKRSLAFAFFVATALEDLSLSSRVVIIDDPMCSLDRNRRHHTQAILRKFHASAEQLILLAHDPYFLREVRDGIRKVDKNAALTSFRLDATSDGFSDFYEFDIDKECESAYARHHRQLYEYSRGFGGEVGTVSKLIRPLLEGYLHRRFPGLLPKDLMFGQIVVLIRDADASSPLSHAKGLVPFLNEINDYAGQFHHETDPEIPDTVNASELKVYVDRALGIVHGAPLA